MHTDEELLVDFTLDLLVRYGLSQKGWTVVMVDENEGRDGYCDQETKTITMSRMCLPTAARNLMELAKHEVAHALCGHGDHNLEWWDKLISIGGCGVWVSDEGVVYQARVES